MDETVKLTKEFIVAWEKHTSLEWVIDHQGKFHGSYCDFKAGWDAAIAINCKGIKWGFEDIDSC